MNLYKNRTTALVSTHILIAIELWILKVKSKRPVYIRRIQNQNMGYLLLRQNTKWIFCLYFTYTKNENWS